MLAMFLPLIRDVNVCFGSIMHAEIGELRDISRMAWMCHIYKIINANVVVL